MIPMKLKNVLILAATLVSAASLSAGEKVVAGPKGGRLLENTAPQAEFFVNDDRKVEINFYEASKPVAPGAQLVAITAEPKTGRKTLEMEKTGTGYVSKAPLPDGEPYRVVVQLRENPDARPQNYRISLNLEECGGCSHAEYACTCGH